MFVKNLVQRAIDVSLKEFLSEMHKQSVNDPVFTVARFRNELVKTDPQAAEKVDNICRLIRPRFVYNMVESTQDTQLFANIDATCAEVLSIDCDHFGVIPYDDQIRRFMKRPGAFFIEHPDSTTSQTIDRLSRRIVNLWDTPLEGSAEVLAKYAREVLPDNKDPLLTELTAKT